MCVALGSSVPSKERSDISRTSIKGEFVSLKPKALLVSTLRGVPFNSCEQSEPSRTRIEGRSTSSKTTYLSLISSYKTKHLNSSKFYYFVV